MAIQQLVRHNVPFVFVSNTCMMESEKAEQLSDMLEVHVSYYIIQIFFFIKNIQ